MTLREYAKLMNDTALQGSLSNEEYNRLYKPLLDGIQSMIPPMLFRYRSCNELSLQALWDDKIWLSKGNVMNDDYDALLYFDKAKITAHVLQAINEFSRLASRKVSWEELPQIVQHFFPREILCQMMEAIAHITVGDMESYLRHFEAFSRNAIKAYSPKISVLTQNTLKFACFSDTITSANMWGHYASSSTGFSIGYNFRGFPCVDSVGEGNSELPTRCELFPIIYQSKRYDATPYAEYTMRSPLVVLGSFVMDSWWLNFTTPRCTWIVRLRQLMSLHFNPQASPRRKPVASTSLK